MLQNYFLICIWVLCLKFTNGLTADTTCLNVANTCFFNYYLIEKHSKTYAAHFFNVALLISILLINKSVFSLYRLTVYRSINYLNCNSFSLGLFPFLFYRKKWLPKIHFFLDSKRNKERKFEGMHLCGTLRINSGFAFFKKIFKKCYDGILIEHIYSSGKRCHFN